MKAKKMIELIDTAPVVIRDMQPIVAGLARLSPISQAKPEERPAMPWNAPVHVEKLFTAGGVASDFFAVVAEPSGMSPLIVGKYSRGDCLVPNADLVSRVETALDLLGYAYTKTITLFRDGSGIEILYDVLGYEFQAGHSLACPQIKIRNSYDGVWRLCAEICMKVLLCLNHAEGYSDVASLTEKHSSKLTLDLLQTRLPQLIESGMKDSLTLERLADFPLENTEQAYNLFANIHGYSKGLVSKRQGAQMFNAYLNPDIHEAQLAPSLWRAFMAGTRAMRDLRELRPTVAGTANQWLGKCMGFAVNPVKNKGFLHGAESPLAQLLATPKNDWNLIEVDIEAMA